MYGGFWKGEVGLEDLRAEFLEAEQFRLGGSQHRLYFTRSARPINLPNWSSVQLVVIQILSNTRRMAEEASYWNLLQWNPLFTLSTTRTHLVLMHFQTTFIHFVYVVVYTGKDTDKV